MLDNIPEYLVVFATSMLKFIGGPLVGAGFNLSLWETAIFTILGMMASVFIFSSILGRAIHNWMMKLFFKNRKLFSAKSRKRVKLWRKYGLKGVAFLTPIVFTPIGGTLIATSFGEHRNQIFIYMLASAVFWGFLFSYLTIILRINSVLDTVKDFIFRL
ncbi:MAG: hypothetical protein K2X86_00850 [Cytophagaceae bacterium]|nr:hypothetical protein [Cytophagaceae bacterium]